MPVRVRIVTLGCPKNEVDSEKMAALVRLAGAELTADEDAADITILNTCAFIREATEEAIEHTLDLALRWKPAAAGRRLIVAGCLPSRYGRELVAELPEVDAFIPVAEEHELLKYLEALAGLRARPGDGPGRAPSGPYAYLKVTDGCFRACAYCTIPAIRGRYRSMPMREVLHEASALVRAGAREVVLVGQDTSSWGRDLDGHETLADVVRGLAALDGFARLRLMYVQPDGVTDDLLDAIAAAPNVCRYLDIPLQHASRDVLRRMARSGDADAHLALLGRIRDAIPGVVLRTSLIAGFPGETERDLELLDDFLEEARFDYAGVFAYSPEEGTPAARMRPRIPARERVARANHVRETADRIGFDKAAERVGETLDVLVEGTDEDGLTVGRWQGQAPEVDGVVSWAGAEETGAIVRVRITEALGYDLAGERPAR